MSNSSFPSNVDEALAILYLESQDLSGLTPEEIYDKYKNAYNSIHKHRTNHSAANTSVMNSPF